MLASFDLIVWKSDADFGRCKMERQCCDQNEQLYSKFVSNTFFTLHV